MPFAETASVHQRRVANMVDVVDDFVDEAHRTGFEALADRVRLLDRIQDRICLPEAVNTM
jgi:hypothetical protein